MKDYIRRGLAWIMVLCMVFSLVPGAAMPVRAEEDAPTVNGYYDNSGNWIAGGTGTITHDVDGTEVSLSKTAQAVEGMENTFEITLQVKTSTSSSVKTNSGAVVLVIDTSSSMKSCTECGQRDKHSSGCVHYVSGWNSNNDVTAAQNRLTAAKAAAKDFLASYAGSDANATRMLAIVTFDGGYRTNMSWNNVAGGSGSNSYNSARNTIDGLDYDQGTNMEGGLKLALDLLGSDDVSGFGSMNVVLLSDGAPSQRIGNSDLYGSNKADCDAAARQASAIRATGSKLYTVCFGAARDNAYDNVTVSSFLSSRIASSGCAYDADNTSELNAAFKAITESITSGLNGSGWTTTDPMAPHSNVSGGTGENFYRDGDAYTWELSDVTTQTEGNTTYYIYTYKYRVTFDPQFEGFVEGEYYPTNKETYLNIEGKQYAFPVPGVQAKLPRRDVTVTKVWNDEDNRDGIRPTEITVQLMEGERTIGDPVVLNEDNGWSYTWDGEQYNLIVKTAGKVHEYTVKELTTSTDYTASVSFENSKITLTNTHEVYRKDITVTKKWDDKDNQDGIRPGSISVNLLANGTVVDTAELSAPDWTYTFKGFKINENGEPINYTVEEVKVPDGYTASVDGLTVTNKHEVEKTSVTAAKIWDDNNNQDGIRPGTITVKLLANGVDTGKTLTLTAATGWTGEFVDLDKYANGKEIVYTIVEVTVPEGYTASVSGMTVTNKHVPSVISISGSKTWLDNDNQDGVRPESITVHLKSNGTVIATRTVTAADGWAWTFENLPEFEAGKRITYTVVEDAVDNYSTTYNGYNITNTHTPAKLSVTVSKIWDDNQNQDGIRPNDITIHLLVNGEVSDKTLTLNAGNSWTGSFTNLPKYKNGAMITYTIAEVSVDGYTTSITGSQAEGYTVTNTHKPESVSVSGAKTWIDNNNQDGKRPESITINLLANGAIIDTRTVTAAEGWAWSFENLPKFEAGVEISYSITENSVDGYVTEYNGFDVINTHAPEKTSVSVTKSWQDNNNQDGIRPNDITVKLLANGKDTGLTLVLNQGNNWTSSFTDLDKYENGAEIIYTVEELAISNYETIIDGSQSNGYTIINVHEPETIQIEGAKTWIDNDNQDGKRPESITINLLADGKIIKTLTVSEKEGWAWSFENLPKFEAGTEIVYSVNEEAVENYSTEYNGFNVTNTHAPEKTSVSVTKAWADSNNQDGIRPNDVTIKLLANGEDTGLTLILNSGNNWTGSFTELDKYEDGEVITYTVEELQIEGYESVITGSQENGYTVTNSHNPKLTEIAGSKTWNDNNNQDGKRPESITIKLLADGKIIKTLTVTEADNWSWSFESLPVYRDQGVEIVYSITENGVEEYVTDINNYNVTNTHAPEKTSVNVVKSWADNNDQDGIRPNDITVKLLANGKDTGLTLVLNHGNSWNGSFTDLDKYENGKVITYTVEELQIKGYESVITGDQKDGYIITNSHNPETIQIEGAKTWIDNDNQDGKRPESITIKLLADGKVIKTLTVYEKDGWAWSFENLPKYKDHGTEIVYSVTEESIEDYSTEYNGFNVTNTHAPEKTSVSVTKAWADSNNQDGIRPNDVTIKLLANGEDTGLTLVLNQANNWTGSFTELDKYENGKVITYTVKELQIEGYESVITGSQENGYTVTNSHNPMLTEIAGSKTWNDNNNQDGKRPESITIKLLADGKIIKTLTVTEADNWSWSFESLPVYRDQGVEIVYSITENGVEEYVTDINNYNVTNTHAPEKTSVNVVKSWADNNDQDGIRPNDITVKLLANGEDTGLTLVLNQGNNWNGSFTDLDKYENGNVITYTVEELQIKGYEAVITGDQKDGYKITNSHNPETIQIEGAKTWIDNDNQDGKRPESITINLLADGTIIKTLTVYEKDGWAWSFENLPKYKDHGSEIVYSVTEEAIEDYSTEYNGFNVTNTHAPEKTSVTVTKAWADSNNQDGIRPNDVTIKLLANGKDTGLTLVLNQANNWTGSFTELDKYEDGEVITYTVKELQIEGYESVITGDQNDGYTVTNSHNPKLTEIAGSKTWNDNNNQDGKRPGSITIKLLANGKIIKTVTVTEADNWSWSFESLPVYRDQGVEIVYSITENGVEEYVTDINNYNVTNTHAPEKTSVNVVKSWADNNDQDGIRPNDITVKLLANGKDTGLTLVLNHGNSWNGSFTDLDKYENGNVITYTVEELQIKGYEAVITGDQKDGYKITNSHNPETIQIEGAKTWNDNDNQDGKRPESITINLLADGKIIKTLTVTEADNWAWSFENLPKYKDHGTEIVYSVTEETIEDYSTEYNGFNVTNTHAPEKTSVTVTKAWSDSNNQDGIRPNDVTIELLANGEDTGLTLILNSGNNWTGSFTELDKYEDGKVITYTVKELQIEGYESVITGDQKDGYTVTNSHNPKLTEIAGSKTWNDNNNQDGKRPESITINLLADGKIIKTVTVTEADNWAWSFESLPVYRDQGVEIVYSVTENGVDGYITKYDGFDVTNKHDPDKTSVTVVKSWADSDDQDGIRPKKIKVVLIANGEETNKTLTLDADNNWTDSFTKLDKFADGVEIVYTVAEVEVEGYESVVSGDQTAGYIITNSHNPETIQIKGAKTWDDNDNQDGKRPESITINLLADGKVIKTVTVTEADNWAWSFENLPKYHNHGEEIVYAITEEAVAGYTTVYDGYNVTNRYTPEEVSVTVTKAWADTNNKEGLRPKRITVYLYANGEKLNQTLVLTADDNWVGSFVGLPKYDDGKEITYTIGEKTVKDYNTVIRGDMVKGFTITNSRTYIPKTGDERAPIVWTMLLLASAAMAAYVLVEDKKRRMNNR